MPASDGAIRYTPPSDAGLLYKSEEELFSEALYLALNPDVADLVAHGIVESGRAHWLAGGRLEEMQSRRPRLAHDDLYEFVPAPGMDQPIDTSGFDAESYYLLYPDVRQAMGGAPDGALHHWLHYGTFRRACRQRYRPLPQLAGAGRRCPRKAVRH